MKTKGILFDLYGTLIDIETDESLEEAGRLLPPYYHFRSLRIPETR